MESLNRNEMEKLMHQFGSAGPYSRGICMALVAMGEAVALALSCRDRVTLNEMRNVTNDMFQQAEASLDTDVQNVQ